MRGPPGCAEHAGLPARSCCSALRRRSLRACAAACFSRCCLSPLPSFCGEAALLACAGRGRGEAAGRRAAAGGGRPPRAAGPALLLGPSPPSDCFALAPPVRAGEPWTPGLGKAREGQGRCGLRLGWSAAKLYKRTPQLTICRLGRRLGKTPQRDCSPNSHVGGPQTELLCPLQYRLTYCSVDVAGELKEAELAQLLTAAALHSRRLNS